MNVTIWKFSLPVRGEVELLMPIGAHILTVQMQYGEPCIWAMVNPDTILALRRFRIYGTGHPITQQGTYLGTFQIPDGNFVGHVFEVLP